MSKKNKPEPKSMKAMSPKDRRFIDKHMMGIMNAIHLPTDGDKETVERSKVIKTIMAYTQGMYSDLATYFQQGFLYSAKPKFHKDIFVTNAYASITINAQDNAELYCMLTDNFDELEFWAVFGYFTGLEYKGIRREE